MPTNRIIELTGEDGSLVRCRMIDLVSFDDVEYALLLTIEDKQQVLMRHEEMDGQSRFCRIDDDEEFDRVVRFVRELARQARE